MSYLDSYIRRGSPEKTVYSGLASRKQVEEALSHRKYYHGRFGGESVSFDRMFRGREMTDDECRCLCDGMVVRVYGLTRKSACGEVTYGAEVHLERSSLPGLSKTFYSTVIRAGRTLVHDPDYVFSVDLCRKENEELKRRESENAHPKLTAPISGEDLGQLVDEFSDEEDAKLAAMIAAPELPLVQKVETDKGQISVYVPVIYMDDENTVVPGGHEPYRVSHDTGQCVDAVETVYGKLDELSEQDMRMENEMALLEESGDVSIAEGLEIDDDDRYEDDEGYEELPWESESGEPAEEIDDDGIFE